MKIEAHRIPTKNEAHRVPMSRAPVARLLIASAVLAGGTAFMGFRVPAAAQTRPFTAEDMLSVVGISGGVAMAPDGGSLAFVLPDLTDEWNVGERAQVGTVHVLDLDGAGGGVARPVGTPGQRSSFPAFAPDGGRIAMLVETEGGHALAVWDVATGTLRNVGSTFDGTPGRVPQWAGPSHIVYERPSAAGPEPETPRIRVLEISDPLPGDAFFQRTRRAGLAIVDVRSGAERALVPDRGGLVSFSVSPDGRHVVGRSSESRRPVLWTVGDGADPVAFGRGGDRPVWLPDGSLLLRRGEALATVSPDRPAVVETLVVALDVAAAGLLPSPDGSTFVALGVDATVTDPEIEPSTAGMYTIARPFMDLYLVTARSGRATNLTSNIRHQIRSPVWSDDGRSIYFVAIDNETYDETLFRHDVASGRREALAGGRESFGALSPTRAGVLASIQSATAPPDLWHVTDAGTRTRVTDLNPQLADFHFSEPELFHFDNHDGDRLGALLYRATGPGSGADEPVVTYVYEKLTPGVHRFQPRQQIFATHGYAVLMPNVKVKVGETGTSFVKAVVPAVEAVFARGFTNRRACLWGGSFGAYATSFVITQTDLFDCAVSRATPPELFRNWASGRDRDSDNIERGQARMGGSPFEVPDNYLSQSAFFHLDQVQTPVLITHGMKDQTILFEEGAMMFYALRRLGKAATFVAYREGDHSLYRHSRADALDVHARMLDWFAAYLR